MRIRSGATHAPERRSRGYAGPVGVTYRVDEGLPLARASHHHRLLPRGNHGSTEVTDADDDEDAVVA
jgi:hypothetical protein